MSTASGLPINQALEKIAEFLADGQYESAEALLPEIIANGDEIQQQMGALYQEQLCLLRAEADDISTEVSEEIPSFCTVSPRIKDDEKVDLIEEQNLAQEPTFSDIDQRLEKVAELFADGHIDAVETILPTIIAYGDETQKKMGEAYIEQLSILRTMDEGDDAVSYHASTTEVHTNRHEAIHDHNLASKKRCLESDGDKSLLHADSFQQPATETIPQEKQDDHVPSKKNSLQSSKKRSLGEAVLERAISLIGVDNDRAIKLLHRVAEADPSEHQRQALRYLAQLDEGRDLEKYNNEDTVSHFDISETDKLIDDASTDLLISAPVNESKQSIDSPAITILDTGRDKAKVSEDSDSTDNHDCVNKDTEYTTISPYTDDQSEEKLSTFLAEIEPDTNVADKKTILQENIDGLLRPGDVLEEVYESDTLPLWSTDAGSLQHDKVEHNRQGFYIGDVAVMIDFADGSELMDMPVTYIVPNAPQWLIGLTNVHSRIIPVFDLVRFFGFHESTKLKKMMLILGHDDSAIGIVITGIPKRIQWNESNEVDHNTAPQSLRNCIRSAYLLGEQLWFDLDCDALTTNLKAALHTQ